MRRMYGDFQMATQYGPPNPSSNKRKREIYENDLDDIMLPPGVPDFVADPSTDPTNPKPETDSKGDSYFSQWRSKRQSTGNQSFGGRSNQNNQRPTSGPTRPSNGPNPPNEPVTGR